MYECPNCGGNLKFDIPTQQLACAHCGTHLAPYQVKKETDAMEQDYFETTVFTCPQCAGEIFSTDNEATSFCSFCGASTILSSRISREKRPKYIIPFKKTKEDCKQAYVQKMRKAFFVPKELRDPQFIDGFRGIYMPYWTYQLTQRGGIKLFGEKTHREGNYIITDHYNLKGNLDAYYLGYSYDASSSFYDNISEVLAPYDAKKLVNFTPAFLSGFYADTADIGEEVYRQDAIELANNSTLDKISKEKAFSDYSITSSLGDADLQDKLRTKLRSADNTMYPVWFMSYRNGDRVAYATVNGQTGKVVADMPISPLRYLLFSLAVAVPIFLLLNLFFTFRPSVLMGIAAVLALVCSILYISEMNAIGRKETNEDDRALEIVRRKKQSQEAGKEGEDEKETGTGKKKKKAKKKQGKGFRSGMIAFTCFIYFGTFGFLLTKLLLWPLIFISMIVCMIVGICRYKKVKDVKGLFGFLFATAAVVISSFIKLFHPVSDLYYYAGAILTLAADGFIFIDIIRNYNKLAMRRLPQFDKRGGDDRA